MYITYILFDVTHSTYFVCEVIVKFLICHRVMSSVFNIFFSCSPMEVTIVGQTCECWFYSIYCVDGVFVGFTQQTCVTHHNLFVVKHHRSTAFLTADSFANELFAAQWSAGLAQMKCFKKVT